jgi:hypothetical protein
MAIVDGQRLVLAGQALSLFERLSAKTEEKWQRVAKLDYSITGGRGTFRWSEAERTGSLLLSVYAHAKPGRTSDVLLG